MTRLYNTPDIQDRDERSKVIHSHFFNIAVILQLLPVLLQVLIQPCLKVFLAQVLIVAVLAYSRISGLHGPVRTAVVLTLAVLMLIPVLFL